MPPHQQLLQPRALSSAEHQQSPITLSSKGSDFELLPSIQKWVKKCNSSATLTALSGVLEQIDESPFWLASVIDEIEKKVPVGKMTRNIWELSTTLIRCLARQVNRHAGKLAFNLLSRLIKEEDRTAFRISSIMYMLVMRASPSSAEMLFKRMLRRYRQNTELCKPNLSHRITLISAMLKLGEENRALKLLWTSAPVSLFNLLLASFQSPQKAEELLKRMEIYLRNPSNGTQPALRSFDIVLKKWANAGDWGNAKDVLDRVIAWSKVWPMLRPNIDFFVNIIEAYSFHRGGGPNPRLEQEHQSSQIHMKVNIQSQPSQNSLNKAVKRVDYLEYILREMNKLSIPPTCFCIGLVVRAWIEAGKTHEAERVINEAREACDIKLCNLVLRSWSLNNVQRAEDFFEWMYKQGQRPDLNSYQILFLAWEKSQNSQRFVHIEYLLRHLEKQVFEGYLCPTRDTYELAINALSKPTHKLEVLKLWHRIEGCKRGDVRFPCTIKSNGCRLAQSSMNLVEDLFARMERARVSPTEVSFECVISALDSMKNPKSVNRRHLERQISIPDAESCNLVLAICFSSSSSQAKMSVRSMVLHLMREYKSGNLAMRPMAASFTRLYSRLYDARQKIPTEAAIGVVEDITFPDETFASACFTYALTVCAVSRNPNAPLVAHRLWQVLPQPASHTYLKLVLRTYAHHPRHALSTLAETLFLSNLQTDIVAEDMLGLVIGIMAKQRRPQDAYALLHRFEHFVSRPTILASILLACALSSPKYQRWHHFQLAFRVFTKWKESNKTITSLHYLYLLTCAMRLPSALRTTVVQKVLNQCRADGLITQSIMRRCQSLQVY